MSNTCRRIVHLVVSRGEDQIGGASLQFMMLVFLYKGRNVLDGKRILKGGMAVSRPSSIREFIVCRLNSGVCRTASQSPSRSSSCPGLGRTSPAPYPQDPALSESRCHSGGVARGRSRARPPCRAAAACGLASRRCRWDPRSSPRGASASCAGTSGVIAGGRRPC